MTSRRVRHIELALQGGGAHGAFTWGVLDRLLEDERIEIAAISSTSAGAMNAVVLADGLMRSLRNAGCTVDQVGTGSEADAALALHEFDVVILDLGLPKMHGLEVPL